MVLGGVGRMLDTDSVVVTVGVTVRVSSSVMA